MPSPRVQALLDQMTTAELVACCHASSYFAAGGVPRLGIPPLHMADGPLGVRPQTRPGLATPETEMTATAFPASIAIAASFDPGLAAAVGAVMGAEARAWDIQILLAPGVNHLRTPLCGRNFEYFGEDPHLTGQLAAAFIRAVQAQGVAACIKHLAGNTQELNRKSVDVHADERNLREIELPPFRAAVDAGVWTAMGAYNRLYGQWCCQHGWLLDGLLRREWGFDGLVVSDWNALNSTWDAAWGGLDVEMGTPRPFDEFHLARPFRDGIAAGIYPRGLAEQKAGRVLGLLERLGMLPGQTRPGPGRHTCPEHHAVARRAAIAGTVLLRNDGILPLAPGLHRIAVIGDNATAKHCRSGGSSCLRPPHEITPLEALRAALPQAEIVHARGYPDHGGALRPIPPSLFAASGLAGGLAGWRRAVHLHRMGEDAAVAEDTVQEAAVAAGQRPHPACTGSEWTVRWSAEITPERDGAHAFVVLAVGGWGVISIDGQRVLKVGHGQDPALWEASVDLAAGRPVRVEAVFHGRDPHAAWRLGWRAPGDDAAAGDLHGAAVAAARDADVVLYLGGLSHAQDTEDSDRTDLALPYGQDRLIADVAAANPNIVVALWGGGPVLMPWLDRVRAALLTWYPGMEGGAALADILTGAADPGGRLPCTFPAALADSPAHALDDYRADRVEHREGLLVGYRWADARARAPLFPFGHGLSYARFAWSDAAVRADGDGWIIACTVANVSGRAGTEVVQLYVAGPPSAWERPPQELKAFAALHLAAGEARRVELALPRDRLARWLPGAGWRVEPGAYELRLSASSRDARLRAAISVG